jgi:Transposase IS66 family
VTRRAFLLAQRKWRMHLQRVQRYARTTLRTDLQNQLPACRTRASQLPCRDGRSGRSGDAQAQRTRPTATRPQHDYLRFTNDWRIPPDNNGSERDIRMIKLRQKVSGCLRTLTGAHQFCTIRSYLSTAAKHGHAFFDTLVMLAEGQPWMPAGHDDLTSHRSSSSAMRSASPPRL